MTIQVRHLGSRLLLILGACGCSARWYRGCPVGNGTVVTWCMLFVTSLARLAGNIRWAGAPGGDGGGGRYRDSEGAIPLSVSGDRAVRNDVQ